MDEYSIMDDNEIINHIADILRNQNDQLIALVYSNHRNRFHIDALIHKAVEQAGVADAITVHDRNHTRFSSGNRIRVGQYRESMFRGFRLNTLVTVLMSDRQHEQVLHYMVPQMNYIGGKIIRI